MCYTELNNTLRGRKMIIYNAKVNNRLCSIKIENGVIKSVDENVKVGNFDANGNTVIAGLVDVHTHGIGGVDTMDCDFESLCKTYAEAGTTAFLPTTMTLSTKSLKKVCETKSDFLGAKVLGIHLEGPYISKNKKGAQNEEFIKNPSLEEFSQFKNVKMITVAPEKEGSEQFIKEVSKSCVVSLGHTECDYETADKAIKSGAKCVTHLFNAMPPLNHRDTSLAGAAIDDDIYVQVICDGLHICKSMINIIFKLFSTDKIVFISDSLNMVGCPDGLYSSGGLDVYLKNGEARLENGTLAGSCVTLWQCVKKAVEFGIPFEVAVKCASENGAKLLGVKKGKIEEGYDADLLVIDESLNIKNVIIDGKVFK